MDENDQLNGQDGGLMCPQFPEPSESSQSITMAFYGQRRLQSMQEEMERFEQEIAGQLARPPMPRMAGSGMSSLRFIPHQLHPRSVTYAPPLQPPQFHQNITNAAGAAAAMAATAMNTPRFQPIPAAGQRQPASAVIEAAPTRYTTTTADIKKEVEEKKPTPKAQKDYTHANADVKPVIKKEPGETSQSKSGESKSSSNSTLAYTVIGGNSKPSTSKQAPKRPKNYLRVGGGQVWKDMSLNEWDPNDFRIFCGDLGNEVSDELLAKAFRQYPSFQKAKVVRDKRTNKTKGYGFVSFKDPDDFTRALREMDGKYVGNRPIKLRKSAWKDRNYEVVKKKTKIKNKLGLKL